MRQQSKEEILGLFGTNLFQIADCVSVPTFCHFFSSSLVAFGEFTFQKLVTNQLFGLEVCAVRQDIFYPRQVNEQSNFYKSRVFISLVGPSETGKSEPLYNWLKIGTFQPKFVKIYFFFNIPNLYTMLCNRKFKISSLCVE